jgi:hypothetical protein
MREQREKRIPKPRLTYNQLVAGSVAVVMATSTATAVAAQKKLYRLDVVNGSYVLSSVDKKKGARNAVLSFPSLPTEDELRAAISAGGLIVDSVIWRNK